MEKTLGKQLRKLRLAQELSQADLSARSGVSLSVICHLEQGRQRDVRLSTIGKLSEALNVPFDSFDLTLK